MFVEAKSIDMVVMVGLDDQPDPESGETHPRPHSSCGSWNSFYLGACHGSSWCYLNQCMKNCKWFDDEIIYLRVKFEFFLKCNKKTLEYDYRLVGYG